MIVGDTAIKGVYIVDAELQLDERGSFARIYCEQEFADNDLKCVPVQCSVSHNMTRGTLRGLHYQADPQPESKLVRCTRGRAFDVAVDLRQASSTYCRWVGVELSAGKANALFVPGGCAHGFLTLEDDTDVFYMMDTPYAPHLARGVRWDDPAFGIMWPFAPVVLSDRDAQFAHVTNSPSPDPTD